jgi:predicted phage terminase large subunit-like protein
VKRGIDPKTGRRYGWVPPEKLEGIKARSEEERAALYALKEAREREHAAVASQIEATKRTLAAHKAVVSFIDFVKFTSPDPAHPNDHTKSRYQVAKHHAAIARVLEEAESGNPEYRQVILTMPPRHGKSELVSRRLPAWFLGRHPDKNVVVATYNDDFAADFGAEVRAIMTSPTYKLVFPKMTLRRGGAAKDRIQTNAGGLAVFVGKGGSLTGRGAHLLLIDDLLKDAAEASSQAMRDQAWNWFTKVAMTRRMGNKQVIMTFTRWHSDDPIGRLTDPENPFYNAQEAKNWKIINLPAIAEEDDPLGRPVGAPLWPDGPDTFDLEFLQSQQRLDPMGFAALYQQRPSAVDGILFRREHIRYYRPENLPDDLRIYAASDHAVSVKQNRDYTVMLIVGLDRQQNIYLLDCFWERATTDRVVETMIDMAQLRNPLIWWAERGHITQSIGPFLKKRMMERQAFFNVVEVTPAADKQQRAQSIAGRMSLGYVWFPKDAPWVERAINELMAFPNGNHDDFVDTLSYIGLGLRSQFAPSAPAAKQGEPKFGSFAWVKAAQKRQDLEDARRAHGGF